MTTETPLSLFITAKSLFTRMQNEGFPKMASLRDDGAIGLTDFPPSVESPNASLIIAPDGSIVSGHNADEVERIFRQFSQ